MEIAKGIQIPVVADRVLNPDVYYGGALTGIYFETEDEQFGRITFLHLDSIKVCRGEYLPFESDWKAGQDFTWVYKVENSTWLNERFNYENENYGSSYEFGGDVKEMLTDFSHYVFRFHDQFVEAIAKGFWFEQNATTLFQKPLQDGHPMLPLPDKNNKTFEIAGISYKVRFNPRQRNQLIEDTQYCPQKLMEFLVEFEGEYSISHALIIMLRQRKLISVLSQSFGTPKFESEGVATFEEIKPLFDEFIGEVAIRRRQMRQ